jgi:long-chain acyl-CoA synthetase
MCKTRRVEPPEPDEEIRPACDNLADLLRTQAAQRPDVVAISDAHRRLTWSGLDTEVDRVAAGLTRLGLVAGYRVAISLGNRVEFVTSYLAALRAGLVAVPLNPASPTGDVVRVLADCGARVCICEAGTAVPVRGAVAGLADALAGADPELRERSVVPLVVVVDAPALPGEHHYQDLAGTEAPIASPRDPEALAVLLYTSGTSDLPRAAMLTHRALLTNIEQAAQTRTEAVRQDDVVLGVLPLFHVFGLNVVLGQVLRKGARLVLAPRFDPAQVLDLVQRESVTNLPVAPPVLEAWAERPDVRQRLSSVRQVLVGAAPMTVELASRFEASTGVQVHRGYGLTEAAPAVASTLMSAEVRPGSVGRPLPGVELRIVEDGADVDAGETGEVWVRGENLFSGYWPDGDQGPGEDGWYATGDVGFLDEGGDLFLVDRLKEILVVSGFSVYPSEIEDVIGEVEGVLDAAVIGAADPAAGAAVVAYVVPDPAAGLGEERLAERIRAHCEQRLARFKQPRDLHVVPELPRSVTGRVAKGRLRATERRRSMGLA